MKSAPEVACKGTKKWQKVRKSFGYGNRLMYCFCLIVSHGIDITNYIVFCYITS